MTTRVGNAERRRHILVVDDEDDNRALLEIVLTHDGYFVTSAAGGVAALESIAAHAPDLVLLDLMMPDMNGYQVATRIKAALATQHIIVILFSALNDADVRARAIAAGARELLTKPMGSKELCARLNVHLPHTDAPTRRAS